MDKVIAPPFDGIGVRILNNGSVETIWDFAGPGSGNNLHPSESPNALKPNVDTAYYGPAPKTEVSNDTPLNSKISTLPLTEPLANSPRKIDNVVTEGIGDIKIVQPFACPFRKHNPERYTLPDWRSCAFSGFPTLSRLKEHLYRKHSLLYQCIRCQTTFKDNEMLNDHMKSRELCVSSPTKFFEGKMNPETELRLRSKQVKQWDSIYNIFSPNDPVPSPFFDPVIDQTATSLDLSKKILVDYEEDCGAAFPRVFKSSLGKKARRPQGSERSMRSNDDTISYGGTPSLTTGGSTAEAPSEDNYWPSSATIHNTEFKGSVEGCFLDKPLKWWELKHREQAHEASNQNLPLLSEVPNIDVSSTTSIPNSDFRNLENSRPWETSCTEEGTSSFHMDSPKPLLAESNVAQARATPNAILTSLNPQGDFEAPKLAPNETPRLSLTHSPTMRESSGSGVLNQEFGSNLDGRLNSGKEQQTIHIDQMEVEPYEASEAIDSGSCRNMYEDAEAEGRNSTPSSEMTSPPKTGRKEEINAESLVKSVLLCLGEPFIDRLVDELQHGQTIRSPKSSDATSNSQGSPSPSSTGQAETTTSASTVSATTSITGRKRSRDTAGDGTNGAEDGAGDGSGQRKRQRGSNGQPKRSRSSKLFACPFRKNDPEKYSFNISLYKTCATGSWPDISHLKEHIERVHKAKCSSCNGVIKDQHEHHIHQQNSASQEMECKEVDGLFDDAMVTLKQLKSPTRDRQASWDAVYRHLFPEASPIPDPWFENESKTSAAEDKADLLRKVERLLPQEIATFIETRADVVECLTARLRERLRDNQSSENPEGVSGPAMDPVTQESPFESNIPTNQQDSHLDFGMLDFSNMPLPLSESDAYRKGYEAGHEEGYQQGQKDGYQAGKKAAARTQNRAPS